MMGYEKFQEGPCALALGYMVQQINPVQNMRDICERKERVEGSYVSTWKWVTRTLQGGCLWGECHGIDLLSTVKKNHTF